MTYSEKLKSPKWQKKRLEILNRDEFRCKNCCNDEATLHVHHIAYEYGKDPWDYPNEMLITLCEVCHSTEEYYKSQLDKAIVKAKMSGYFSYSIWQIIHSLPPQPNSLASSDLSDALVYAISKDDIIRELKDLNTKEVIELFNKSKGQK